MCALCSKKPFLLKRGLLYGYVEGTVEEAWWTGAADNGDVTNSGNWLCKDKDDVTVTDGLPSASTHVYFEGALSANIASIACRVCTLTNVTLAADCDLRGLGAALEISPIRHRLV